MTLREFNKMSKEIILSVRMEKLGKDKEKFELLLADLDKSTLDRLKFFIFEQLIKDKMEFMYLDDLEFLRDNNFLEDLRK